MWQLFTIFAGILAETLLICYSLVMPSVIPAQTLNEVVSKTQYSKTPESKEECEIHLLKLTKLLF